MNNASHDCCKNPLEGAVSANVPAPHAHHHAHASSGSLASLTTAATLHCLTGCAIGEWTGLAIGVSLGLNPWATMALATALGFASGYALGLWPLVKTGLSWAQAFKTIWLGETISIAAMELAMNFTDYHVGGVQAASVFSLPFWLGFAAALPAGFLVAWPVNYWLLRKNVKQQCH
ncbi:MAG: DUF4396 domain-containing protein [Pseudomonadota bacterium]